MSHIQHISSADKVVFYYKKIVYVYLLFQSSHLIII